MGHNLLSEDDDGSVGGADHKGAGRRRKGRKGGKHMRKTSSMSGESAMSDATLPSGDGSEENQEEVSKEDGAVSRSEEGTEEEEEEEEEIIDPDSPRASRRNRCDLDLTSSTLNPGP